VRLIGCQVVIFKKLDRMLRCQMVINSISGVWGRALDENKNDCGAFYTPKTGFRL